MKVITLSIIIMFTSFFYSQNEDQELRHLLIEKKLIEEKIKIVKTKKKLREKSIKNDEIDLNMVEKLIDQEAMYIEKLISGNYLSSYTKMLQNMGDSPNAKKLEATIVEKIKEFKNKMKAEIDMMPIGNNN